MAVAHDAQTRFPTTDGTVGVDSSDVTTGDRSFTHDPTGVPKGVVVVVNSTATAQPCTGITYDGVAMALEQSATDTTEAGSVWIWVLAGVAVPTTDPATIVLQGCTADAKWATCSTVTAATTGTALVGENTKNTTVAANPTLDVITSAESLLYGGMHGGAASPASYVVGTGYTSQFNNDYGAKSARSSRRTSPVAAGTIVYNFTFATSDDYCIAAIALGEFTLPVGESFDPLGMMGFFGV
jgi:hypothetical protein